MLTNRESEIAEMILVGADDARLAKSMRITHETLRAHLASMRRKLGADCRQALVMRLREMRRTPDMTIEACRKEPRQWFNV